MFAFLLGFFHLQQSAVAQESFNVLGGKLYSDAANLLYHEIAGEAYHYLEERDKLLVTISSQKEYNDYTRKVKQKLAAAFGPLPEKTQLRARSTGTYEYEGLLIEKIIFESRPGFWVTGCVFKRADSRGRLPALQAVEGNR